MKAFHIVGPSPLCTNSFLLISDAGHAAVIDPAADAAQYNALLDEHKATLSLILCTHGHYDHVGSAEALREKWGATLYCEASDTLGDRLYPLSFADSGYAEGEVLTLDELHFKVWHTPGHTEGSVCILCDDLFFTGDTLFHDGTGRTDMPGGSDAKMIASCKKICGLPVPEKAAVLPGHEGFSSFKDEIENNWFIRNMCQ